MIGHAPSRRNMTPPAKLRPAIIPITMRKPFPFSERCGVSSAENNVGSPARGASGALLSLIGQLYRDDGTQDDPGCQKEIAESRQAEAVVTRRSRGGLPPLQKGEPRADHGTQRDQSVYAPRRGRPLRAGD